MNFDSWVSVAYLVVLRHWPHGKSLMMADQRQYLSNILCSISCVIVNENWFIFPDSLVRQQECQGTEGSLHWTKLLLVIQKQPDVMSGRQSLKCFDGSSKWSCKSNPWPDVFVLPFLRLFLKEVQWVDATKGMANHNAIPSPVWLARLLNQFLQFDEIVLIFICRLTK